MYLAGNYCYQIDALAPTRYAATLLTQITRDNPPKPNQTQQNVEKRRGYVAIQGTQNPPLIASVQVQVWPRGPYKSVMQKYF